MVNWAVLVEDPDGGRFGRKLREEAWHREQVGKNSRRGQKRQREKRKCGTC